jgi:cellulose synthase/poly-beta-1,6-N-acetylglucosamine synthase-like glycosyltransferase|eukprot:g1351.t1
MDHVGGTTNIRSVESRRGKPLWQKTPHRDASEFTDLRYTAVECKSPIEFDKYGYKLRCSENGRQVKVFIVVTMYAEDDQELDGTLRGVCENLKNFPEYDDIAVSWQEVAVCVVSDGRTKANKKTLEFAASMGVYDQEIMYKYGNPGQKAWGATWDTYMHLFEYSVQLKEDMNFEKCYPPLQTMFALKERNGGKLDSHLWFFNAFANHLNPKYCFLLDVGTIPRQRAICKLYQAFEHDPQVAGVCGEIACFKPDYLNPVEASQHFEYKMSHILDKATESIFGYISVLPGAFSAYRYEAIRPGEDGTGPLVDYFKSITASMKDLGPFKANMYLAEDRILCFEIVARNDCNWVLRYVKNAVAETDVPMTLHDLVKQRRRWLNGSFFAILYAIGNFNRVWTRSTHSLARKLAITLQFVTYVINLALNWFLCGTFFIAFALVVDQALQRTMGEHKRQGADGTKCDYRGAESVTFFFTTFYIFLTLVQLICGLGNRPDKMATVYSFCSLFYGILTLLTLAIVAVELADNDSASWKCQLTPQVVSCNSKDRCIPGIISDRSKCVKVGATRQVAFTDPQTQQQVTVTEAFEPGTYCPKVLEGLEWDCRCNDDDVGKQRFGDCQTLCEATSMRPQTLRIATIGTFGSYFIGAGIHGELKHILFSIIQYYYMLPTFINIFSIYSFCNVHDISWGTKGIESAHGPQGGDTGKKKVVRVDEDRPRGEQAQREADAKQLIIQQQREKSRQDNIMRQKGDVTAAFQAFRSYLVIAWVASNAIYAAVVVAALSPPDTSGVADPFFYVCTDQQALLQSLVTGMGHLGGAWANPRDGNSGYQNLLQEDPLTAPSGFAPDSLDLITPALAPCSLYGQSLNIGVDPSTAFLVEQAGGSCPGAVNSEFKCCISVGELLGRAPPKVGTTQAYFMMLFGLIAYTLGLKLVGSVLFLLVRKYSSLYHKSANRKRRNYEIRRQEMAHIDSPLVAEPEKLSRAAVLAGWSATVDPQTNRTYYQNTRTGQTAWEPPADEDL